MARTVSTVEQANFHHLVMDIAWFGLGLAATSRFLSVYAIRLGADEIALSWLAALPAILLAVSTTFAGWWLRHYPDTVRALYWPALLFRSVFFLPAVTPFLPESWRLPWLIISASLPALTQGISGVVFVVMLRQAVDGDHLTRLLSRRSLALNLAIGVGALGFGGWLKVAPFPVNYQVMFLAAFIFALISQTQLISIRVRPLAMAARTPPRESLLGPWRSASFRKVALVALLMHGAFFAVVPLIPLRLVHGLGADEWFMALYGMVELAGGALVSTFGSRLVERYGNRTVIAVSMIGTAAAALIIAVAPSLHVTLLAAAISGGAWTLGAVIGLFGFFAENTNPDEMARFGGPYHQVLALGIFVGPLIGSALSSNGLKLVTVLLIGALFRLLAGLVIQYHSSTPERAARLGSINA